MQELHIRGLVDQSFGLRHSRPAEGRILAREAVVLAERLKTDPTTDDLRAYCWAHLGNALRICNDLRAADRAFSRAWDRLNRGSRAKDLAVRVHELHASLLLDQRAFQAAEAALNAAVRLHECLGDSESQARCLVQKASVAGLSGDPARAVEYLYLALGLIRGARSQVRHAALHNLAWCLVDVGRADLARDVALERAMAPHPPEPLLEVRTKWLGARILAGLGEISEAESELLDVYAEFQRREQWFDAALAALELASIQTPARALGSLQGLQTIFELLGIQREADAAFLLREALTRESIAGELAPRIALALKLTPLEGRKKGRAARLSP